MDLINPSHHVVKKNDHTKIIDPLTTIIRLALLSFKQPGTKISIGDYKIVFHDPNYIQGAMRIYNGDNKEDLCYLELPINIACKKYLDSSSSEYIDGIETIFNLAIKGLDVLKATYVDYGMICKSIDSYIVIIKYYTIKQNDAASSRSLSLENEIGVPLTSDKCKPYLQIYNMWSQEHIKLAIDMLNVIIKADNLEKIHYYKSLDMYLVPFDIKVKHKCDSLFVPDANE